MASGPVPQYPIESVDNALKVVLLLAERGELRLTEVSEYLGVASSSAHRMLAMSFASMVCSHFSSHETLAYDCNCLW